MSSKVKVCIIGAESWGSAIATAVGDNVLQSDKFDERLLMYVYDEHVGDNKLSDIINDTNENIKYLPGIPLPSNLMAVGDLNQAAQDADILIFATPQQFIKPYCNLLAGKIKKTAIAVSLVKGFERINDGEIHLFSQAISRQLAIPCYTLVSANCPMEMAQGKLCEVTIGCDNPVHAELLKDIFQTQNCKVVAIDDVKGVELVGALKDIIALGAGITDGLRLGDNARVAVLHLGLKEMMRFVKGFYPTTKLSTFFEGCGVADLVASCYADKNVQFAKAFVTSGKTIQELESTAMNGKKLLGPMIAEEVSGFLTKQKKGEQFPLFTTIHKICQNEEPPEAIVDALRSHPDLHNLTISNLMEKELSNVDNSKSSTSEVEFMEDTSYLPLNNIFFQTDAQDQEFEPSVEQTQPKEMPAVVATETTNEMKLPEPKQFSWRKNVSVPIHDEKLNDAPKTIDYDKEQGKSSENIVLYDENVDKTDNNKTDTDKNDWMADDEWRPQDFTFVPNTVPAEKRPEEKASLEDADYMSKGDLFDDNQSEFFREPNPQSFTDYKQFNLTMKPDRHNEPLQFNSQVDSNNDFVTAELVKDSADNKYNELDNKDHSEINESKKLGSIEFLNDAVHELDQMQEMQITSKEPDEYSPAFKGVREQTSGLTSDNKSPVGDLNQIDVESKVPDEYVSELTEATEESSNRPTENLRPMGDLVSKEAMFNDTTKQTGVVPIKTLHRMYSRESEEYMPRFKRASKESDEYIEKSQSLYFQDSDEYVSGLKNDSKEPNEYVEKSHSLYAKEPNEYMSELKSDSKESDRYVEKSQTLYFKDADEYMSGFKSDSKEPHEFNEITKHGAEVPEEKLDSLNSKEPDEYIPEFRKTEKPLNLPSNKWRPMDSKKSDEYFPDHNEPFEQPSRPKSKSKQPSGIVKQLLRLGNFGDNFDLNKTEAIDINDKSELLTSAEAADMLDNPAEFAEKAEKARASLMDDSKIYATAKKDNYYENKTIDHNSSGLNLEEDNVRNDRKEERYWYVDDDKDRIETTNKRDESLESYFKRNDNQSHYFLDTKNLTDTEWDWVNLASRGEKRQDMTNALHSKDSAELKSEKKTKNNFDSKPKKVQISETANDNFDWEEAAEAPNSESLYLISDALESKANTFVQPPKDDGGRKIQESVAVKSEKPSGINATKKQSDKAARYMITDVWKSKAEKFLQSRKEDSSDSTKENQSPPKAEKPSRLEATQKSIQQLFSFKADQPFPFEATKMPEKETRARNHKKSAQTDKSETPPAIEYFDFQASEEADKSIETTMPTQQHKIDLDDMWESNKIAEYKSYKGLNEPPSLETVKTENKPNPSALTSVEEMVSKKKPKQETQTITTDKSHSQHSKSSPIRKRSEISQSLDARSAEDEAPSDQGYQERTSKVKPQAKIAQKIKALVHRKNTKRAVREMETDVDYKSESPYHGEFTPYKEEAENWQKFNVKKESDLYFKNKKQTKRPPFNPPFNPRMKIPRPPFDGREHEYHTSTFRAPQQVVSPSYVAKNSTGLTCIRKTFITPPQSKQLRCFLRMLKLTRATKFLCALQFGVIAALLNKLKED